MFSYWQPCLLQKDTKRAVTPYKPPDPVSENHSSDDGSHGALSTPKERGMLSYGDIFYLHTSLFEKQKGINYKPVEKQNCFYST